MKMMIYILISYFLTGFIIHPIAQEAKEVRHYSLSQPTSEYLLLTPPHDLCENAIDISVPTNAVYGEDSPDCYNRPNIETTVNATREADMGDEKFCNIFASSSFNGVVWHKFTTDDRAGELSLRVDHSFTGNPQDPRTYDFYVGVIQFDIGSNCILNTPFLRNICIEGRIEEGFIDVERFVEVDPLTTYYLYIVLDERAEGPYEICIDIDPPSPNFPPNTSRYYNHTEPIQHCDIEETHLRLTPDTSQAFPIRDWPGCGVSSFSIDNPSWITFELEEPLDFEIIIDKCENGEGVQVSLYGPFPDSTIFDPSGTIPGLLPQADLLVNSCFILREPILGPFDLELFLPRPFEKGVYGLIIDGWNGDICNVEIQVLGFNSKIQGTLTPPQAQAPAFIQDSICVGISGTLSAFNSSLNADRLSWSIQDASGNMVLDSTQIVDTMEWTELEWAFTDPGMYEVCVQAENFCDQTPPECLSITAFVPDTLQYIDTICEGGFTGEGLFEWLDPYGNAILPEQDSFDFSTPGTYSYYANWNDSLMCDRPLALSLVILKNTEDPCPDLLAELPWQEGGFYEGDTFPTEGEEFFFSATEDEIDRRSNMDQKVSSSRKKCLFQFYPNPAIDEIYIRRGHLPKGSYEMQVRSTHGKVLKQQQCDTAAQVQQFSVADLPNGYYWLSLHQSGRILDCQPLVIAR